MITSAQEFSNVYQHSSVNTLPFLWVGTCQGWCCCSSCTFEQNPFILSVFVSWFSCGLASMFSVYSDVEIYLPCMPALHTTHQLAISFASSHLSLVKNTFSSSRSSYTRANTLLRDNHRTSYTAIRLYTPLSFPYTELQICGSLAVLPLQSLSYAQYLPAQVPGLLVKSWQRVPPGAKEKKSA